MTDEKLMNAIDNLLAAYGKKYRLARGGIRENAPCRQEVAELWVVFNDIQTAHLKSPSPHQRAEVEYVVWSNEHKCWWGPNNAGYCTRLEGAGRYTRDEALKICIGARGGRQFNSNPTEVPLALNDAEQFWPDDQEEWRVARFKAENPPMWEEEEC